ncbi:exonuclease SbcC [Pseudonocardia hierapolitana]|uniref:Nuclease SbcCD subunit C n=1 Tax=Pseudonocardia hierapolitana TaxID=1128676 RepID=A0A561SL45_9PSEU|nr:AAA family ATPase [Pseudonocardia hierapolitana]TWF75595.1 exonuclease SbcC [Pseudonocardia hierapolitana]
MRPVLLEMAGFGSFREPTTVDFTGADYFAFVGPTGAGKSTVIDAMTFALYGSVPRWDNARTVALALAPTINRGTVRLVFDVGGDRYVVARELRRAASGGVSVRGARLEKLRDASGTGGTDEESEPLADGAGPVTKAVEELLGLPFGDFCTCVVLPQGEFAEFLHTEPRKRQEKLVRILGLGVYDVIAREANSEAAAQRQRAEVLGEQLAGYTDATDEAEQEAAARVAELAELADRVDAAVPELAAASAALESAEAGAGQLRAEQARLAALTVPDGLADLDARHRTAAEQRALAAERAGAAEAADTAARERLAAAPARGPLEHARRDHAELATITAELPGARERHEKAAAAYTTAANDAADARAGMEEARTARDAATALLAERQDVVRRLVAERDALRAIAVPAGLDALQQRRAAADSALADATAALGRTEAADAAARTALAAAPARGPLEQGLRDRRELDRTEAELAAARSRSAEAERDAQAAAAAVAEATHRLDHAQDRHRLALRADLAASLRPALAVGDPCPVCTQAVATLPPPADPGEDLAAAEEAVAAASRAHDEARREEATAISARERVRGEVERLDATASRLRSALAGVLPGGDADSGRIDAPDDGGLWPADDGAPPLPATDVPTVADLHAVLADLDRLGHEAEEAAEAVRAARRARDAAAAAVEELRAEVDAAAAGLRAARDPLVPFGAPAPAVPDVLAGWTALVDWARTEGTARESALPAARAAVTEAEQQRDTTERAWRAAERAAAERHRDETAAARAEQEARSAVDTAERRVAQLQAVLRGAPSDEDAAAALERLDALEAAVREADAQLRTARAALRSAESTAAEVAREVTAAWDALRAARDPLVPLGAPAVGGDELLAAWQELTGWARREAEARAGRLAEAATATQDARAARDAVEHRIADDLAAHQVPVAAPLGAGAPAAVAAALARARAGQDRVAERRAAAERLRADRDEAESAQQVAKLLGNLLRSDGFPRWLVASALDALVADASESLAELSGGQFALTHEGGEFLVIDHADADARRPVKTLSGGETFQASLALALALSAQMTGLAAQGAARLESIFLDEGFGTLDEANLDVVASTLENLATRGDRMVGVVTHVPALAERVPVRFVVSRDQRTSTVTRES